MRVGAPRGTSKRDFLLAHHSYSPWRFFILVKRPRLWRHHFSLWLRCSYCSRLFFYQTYLLIYDVFHHGVTAALNPAEKITAVTEKSEVQKVEKKEMPRWKNIIYSFIAALFIGVFLYYYKPVQRDTFWLYAIGFFILLVIYFFLQTYRMIYDVFRRGVTAALNATDKTTDVTEKSDVQRVEGNKMPRPQDSVQK